MVPALLVLAGLVLLAVAAGLMRRLGPRARVGRLIAATPVVPIARARTLAESGPVRFVAVTGRIDAEEEFEDDHHTPLVFRRRRLETKSGSGWSAIEDDRQTVRFELMEGLDRIAVDGETLDDGLVVMSRESEGFASEVPDRMPAGTPPDTPVRLRIEQVSSVEHAIALGVPRMDADRGPILGPGLGRPLILTTLEPAEAMRLLAEGRRDTARAVAGLLVAGVAVAVAGLAWWVADAIA